MRKLPSFLLITAIVFANFVSVSRAGARAALSCSENFVSFQERTLNTKAVLQENDDSIWRKIRESLQTEVAEFRKLDKAAQISYLENLSTQFSEKLGDRELGAHYNLHGGVRENYLNAGGIKFSMGDSGVAYGMSRNTSRQVYFFNLKKFGLFTVLNERNPTQLFWKTRMGDVLILFDLNKTRNFLNTRFPDIEESEIFFASQTQIDGRLGVPNSSYVALPFLLFSDFKKRMNMRLSWNEQTLIAIRIIESALNL